MVISACIGKSNFAATFDVKRFQECLVNERLNMLIWL